MESMQDRAVALIYKTGLDDLVRQSSISYSRWKNLRHKRVRLSTEEVEVLVKIYPQYALWVASGQIAPESGQTSPDYDEANRNLSDQNAG
ncbi:hypothetical protein FA342_03165 [Pseudomonas aeruginosa]|uniref:hypothetical protein n=1 Tax=Pseudomonas aeruginosa TaxID=287 RepID=UPI0021E176D6|nr:hypothetical protein [Pseudomonas aeruginosa]MCO2224982.1 hypothetical protein [Pseudomonas aeruginosa]MCO2243706.1 hypothetical protein [Pseudomonas aeruginosa]MCO2269052.1 hypothetical protein [Pseudomonas aeruginosa]MCO2296633.1 hypothetical protein [Pseudomonas aeruginosa]MCO2459120.1 hypothetical protein [Pseudomonas aeruginosa]